MCLGVSQYKIMKEVAVILFKTLLCTLAVALGFSVAGWLGIPTWALPVALFPAMYLIQRFFEIEGISFMEIGCLAITLGVSVWVATEVATWGSLVLRVVVACMVSLWVTNMIVSRLKGSSKNSA